MEISVAIPIHNEQANIELLYNDLIAALEPIGSDFERSVWLSSIIDEDSKSYHPYDQKTLFAYCCRFQQHRVLLGHNIQQLLS